MPGHFSDFKHIILKKRKKLRVKDGLIIYSFS